MPQRDQTKIIKEKSHFEYKDQILSHVVDQIRDAVLVWDANEKLILFNESASSWISKRHSGVSLHLGIYASEFWGSLYDYVVGQSAEKLDAKGSIYGLGKDAFVAQRMPKKIKNGENNGEFYNPVLDSFYREKHSFREDGALISVYCDLTKERRHG